MTPTEQMNRAELTTHYGKSRFSVDSGEVYVWELNGWRYFGQIDNPRLFHSA